MILQRVVVLNLPQRLGHLDALEPHAQPLPAASGGSPRHEDLDQLRLVRSDVLLDVPDLVVAERGEPHELAVADVDVAHGPRAVARALRAVAVVHELRAVVHDARAVAHDLRAVVHGARAVAHDLHAVGREFIAALAP